MSQKGVKQGGGSRKGIPNRVTGELKEMIRAALDQVGGVEYLAQQATQSPAAFLSLIGRILPIEQTTLGADGKPIDPTRQTFVWEVHK